VFRKSMTKKRFAVLGAIAILAMAGIAVAYFTSTGSGSGSATVGEATAFKVTVSAATGGPLYPGSGSENLAYTVKNEGSGAQNVNATSASVASDEGGDITQGGEPVEGCKAAWFTATDSSPAPVDLAGSESASGSVEVTMQDSGTNQDACQGASPDITVSAS
jgi:hypothetical protein